MATTTPAQMMLPARRGLGWLLGGLILALIAVGSSAWLARPSAPAWNGGEMSPPLALPALTLQRSTGELFTTAGTRGRLSFFFFGYTICPDVCPMTLAHMAQVLTLLGPDAAGVDVYFITVDPARDTPARLTTYVRAFNPTVVALTGTDEQLAAAMAAFGAAAERRDTPGSVAGYLVDHSASIYLIDQESRLRLVYGPHATPAEIAADVRLLIR